MTNPSVPGAMSVTQEDRDAAADLKVCLGKPMVELTRQGGTLDGGDYCQAFAAHRLAAEQRGSTLPSARWFCGPEGRTMPQPADLSG